MKTIIALISSLLIFSGVLQQPAYCQDQIPASDTLATYVDQLNTDVLQLKNLNISGYLQAQMQFADSAGIPSYAGGSFPAGVDKRFMVRRGRIKFVYSTSSLNQFVLQLDATERGVAIKDAYMKFTDPWSRSFSATAGVFYRPFGYEIEYSSSMRESPEYSRFVQTLFPGEQDLGAMISFQPPKTSRFNFIKLDAGFFSGCGPNKSDFDNFKDFIGRLSLNKSFLAEKVKAGIEASYYHGGISNYTNKVYQDIEGDKFVYNPSDTLTNLTSKSVREIRGIDAQLTMDLPFGITTLRGEFVAGQQPAYAGSAVSPIEQKKEDTYIRDVRGYYFYFVQAIFQTKHQFVFKYDVIDPNTRIKESQIGTTGSNLTSADIKTSALGFGWAYRWDSNIKLTAYYDIVSNDKTHLKGYTSDLKDNVLTLRFQYKF
jgi:hypothetical protein